MEEKNLFRLMVVAAYIGAGLAGHWRRNKVGERGRAERALPAGRQVGKIEKGRERVLRCGRGRKAAEYTRPRACGGRRRREGDYQASHATWRRRDGGGEERRERPCPRGRLSVGRGSPRSSLINASLS